MRTTALRPILLLLAILAAPRSAFAATSAQIEEMITAGKHFLYDQQSADGTWELSPKREETEKDGNSVKGDQWGGRTALCVYTLLASGESPQEPKLQKAIAFLKSAKIVGTYALGVRIQAMTFLPQTPDVKAVIKADAQALLGMIKTKEPAAGFYDYDGSRGPTQYSLSRSQYAVLGVWAAAQMGAAEVPDAYWKTVDNAWRRAQEADGGWAYQKGKYPTTPGITAVGVATLYIAQEYLAAEPGSKCLGNVEFAAIDQGLKYMERNAAKFASDEKYERDFPYATLYAVERIGVAGGRKYFGKFDWFQKGADWLLTKQAETGGFPSDVGGPVSSTCFAMLFLSRGRAPLLMNKLEYTSVGAKLAEWNQRPRDVANLSRWVGRMLERDINWQVVSLDSPASDLHDAPILYISGTNEIRLDDASVSKLRDYVEGGGLIVAQADCGGRAFATSFRALATKAFPRYGFRELPEKHPIYDSAFSRAKWKQKPSVLGLSNGVRELMILIPQADVGRAWQAQSTKTREEAFQLGANLFLYAADRKSLRFRGESPWMDLDPKLTPTASVAVDRLQYSGNWDPEPGGWRRFAAILNNEDRAKLTVTSVDITKSPITAPVAHLTGTAALKLNDNARAAIRKYVEAGGTLLVEAAGGSPEFATSAEAELAAIFPGSKLEVLPANHPVFSTGFGSKAGTLEHRRAAREKAVGKSNTPRLQGITIGNRVAAFYSREDLSAGLTGTSIDSINGYEPASAVAIVKGVLAHAGGLPAATAIPPTPTAIASPPPTPAPTTGPTTRPRTIPRKRSAE